MNKVLVVNASPLILLARVERLDLLVSLAKSLIVPEAVIREIQAGSDRDSTADRRSKIFHRCFGLTISRFPIGSDSGTWEPGSG